MGRAFAELLESRTLLSASYLLDNIYSFNSPNGASPQADLTLDSSGNLFGTTAFGGPNNYGTVFEIAHGTTAITTLASFNSTNGAYPYAGLRLDSSGNLFGTTGGGGTSNYGTVFEIAHGTTAITTLASFNNANGANPVAVVTFDSSGNLFGTTYRGGGANNDGTVFEIVHGTNAVTTLASFNGTNGANPTAGVTLDSSGNLFGTTSGGGTNNYGTVFEIVHGTTTLSTVASFNGTNGDYPEGGLTLDSSGNLFGTTEFGGTNNYGTVFEVVHGTTAITALASFNHINGAGPYASLTLDSSGNLFGTTGGGGANDYGTVFEIVHGTTAINTIASFNNPNGVNPYAGVTLDADGNLFGTTKGGGTNNLGTVFEIVHGTAAITTLASFNNTNGANPYAGVTLDSNGNLFGTTSSGGAYNYGTVFEMVHGTTAITTLASFNVSNPYGSVTVDSSGNLFGTTLHGGTNDFGTVFEIVHGTTAITTLAVFNGTNGASPYGGLTIDSHDNLFGTTNGGGANNDGTVFEIVHGTTAIVTLATFNGTNGANPDAGVSLDASGNLFGTTGGRGTVFEIVHGTATITTLASFTDTSGAWVTLDASGNLFGTTGFGGPGGYGTVFEIVRGANTITTLASFNHANGANPSAGPTLDADGNLFGTTSGGGINNYGTVFEIVHGTTAITTLASFNNTNGAYLHGNLALDAGANLVGTTYQGGPGSYGTVFELSPTPPSVSFIAPPAPATTGSPLNGTTGIQVGVLYPWGNVVSSDASTVTLTLTGGTFSDGSTTKTASTSVGVATFKNLVINATGRYTLTASDNGLTSTAAAAFTIILPGITLAATAGNDAIYFRKNADGSHLDEWLNSLTPGTDPPTAKYLLTGAASLYIDGSGGNDQITFDQSKGDLLETSNAIANVGGSISVKIIGASSNDTLALDGINKAITWNTGASTKIIYFAGVISVEYQDIGGVDNVSVAGPLPLTFDMGPASDVLNVAAGATATVNFGSSNGNLTINGIGNTSLVIGSGNPTFQFVTTPVDPPPPTGAIAGTVFNDANGDGKRESADKGLAGRKLYIDRNRNGKQDAEEPTVITDAAGAYRFAGLAAGTYRVREVLPAGYRASAPSAGYLDVAITGGKTAAGKNFGQTREAQISGVVFRDANRDGIRETSEAGLAGWVVYLDLNHDGKLDTGDISVKTDASGRYSFTVRAGKYAVREVVKSGFAPTAPSAGAYAITLSSGQLLSGKNFGDR